VTDELNVKALDFVDQEADLVEYEIGLLPNLLGPKHGKRYPLVRQAIASYGLGGDFGSRQPGLSRCGKHSR
jgi:hypothetical protein